MSREVYTYKRIKDLPRLAYWNDIKGYPQITVSWGLKRALKNSDQSSGHNEGLFKKDPEFNVTSFRRLQEQIMPNWTTAESRYILFALISACISEKIRACDENDEDRIRFLTGCKNNRDKILYAIELLEEADVKRECFDNEDLLSQELSVFVDCWDYLAANTTYMSDFRKAMHGLSDRSTWNRILAEVFGIDAPDKIDKLVFHGFFYFTPLQKWVVESAEKAGFGIIYLFPYDDRYEYVYETWKNTYAEMDGIGIESWNKSGFYTDDKIGDIFNGIGSKPDNKININQYRSIVDFSKRVSAQKHAGYGIYSPSIKIINDPLMAVIPEEYGERKLLSYPIGKFVVTLCNMWDEVQNTIAADEKDVYECFSSGWLNDGTEKGQDYLYELNQLMPFFSDCKTLEQWSERADYLEEIYETIIPEMQMTYSSDASISRWQSFMGNPLACFSQFSLDTYKVKGVIKLMRKLFGLVTDLFEVEEQTTIVSFVDKLLGIVKQCTLSDDIYEAERKIASEILAQLGQNKSLNIKVYPYDAAYALRLYLNDDFSEDDVLRERSLVKSLFEIDTADILYSGKVHLCICDSEHMPGGRKQYPWPFTRAFIIGLTEKYNCHLLRYMSNTIEKGHIANRYFFYSALNNREVELSWIKSFDNKEYIHSCYIDLVNKMMEVPIPENRKMYVDREHVKEIKPSEEKVQPYLFPFTSELMPKEAKMDYAVCPIKYVFNHVLDSRPSFTNDFHQSYVINSLIKAIMSLCGMQGRAVAENILNLFPQLSDSVKGQIVSYVDDQENYNDNSFVGMTHMGNKYYTEERLKAYFSDKAVRDVAIKKYGEFVIQDKPEKIDFNKTANSGENADIYSRSNPCLFCQFQEHCRKSIFINEVETLYDKA